MDKRYTALEWALMEGGHEVPPSSDKPFSFLQDIFESRMTKDDGNSQKLTYSDCCERLYLMLLVLETLRRYPSYASTVKDYARKQQALNSTSSIASWALIFITLSIS